jgi:hypothetical protein
LIHFKNNRNKDYIYKKQKDGCKTIYEFEMYGNDTMIPYSITYTNNQTNFWARNTFITYNTNKLQFPSEIFQLGECNQNNTKILPSNQNIFKDKRGFLIKKEQN